MSMSKEDMKTVGQMTKRLMELNPSRTSSAASTMTPTTETTGLAAADLAEYVLRLRPNTPTNFDELVQQAFTDALEFRRQQEPVLSISTQESTTMDLAPSFVGDMLIKFGYLNALPREEAARKAHIRLGVEACIGVAPDAEFVERVAAAVQAWKDREEALAKVRRIDGFLKSNDAPLDAGRFGVKQFIRMY